MNGILESLRQVADLGGPVVENAADLHEAGGDGE